MSSVRYLIRSFSDLSNVSSIFQKNTLHPLQITERTMRKLLTFHGVTPDFLEYLFAYGEKSLPSDDGQGRATVTNSLDGAYGMQYQHLRNSILCFLTQP